uniref:SGNH/GDSL hydrolase family protein n=1 Tax=Pseudomonas aeruginosa TaxID=287 RepID=UPI00053CF204
AQGSAAGPREGLVGGAGAEEPLRLLLFGESTVAGVGASCLDYALAGRLAAALGERLRRPVAWQALGENGITSGEARERLLPQVAGRFFDQVILVFGVNDTTSLRSLERWCADCAALIDGFQAAGAQVTCTAVPPLRHFSALPGLLRALLGWRGRLLDEALRDLAGATGAGYCPISLDLLPDYLAIDGFHPSQLGYQVWAGALADWLAAREKGGAAVA